MYIDDFTLAGLFSAISLAGILYGLASRDISRGTVCSEGNCSGSSGVE